MSLTTSAKVKEYLGITHSNWDALITSLIARMGGFIESYCSRKFASATYTNEKYDGREYNGGLLLMNQYPITSVTSLYDDPYREFGADTLIAATDYVLYGEVGAIQLTGLTKNVFTEGPQVIKATYVAGYSTIPGDLEQVCIELIAEKLNTRQATGLRSHTLGRWSVTYGEVRISESMLGVLNRYATRSHVVV